MIRLLILLTTAATVFNAVASSEQSWRDSDKLIHDACLKASMLKDAKAVGDIIHYGDSVGYSALLISGRYSQSFMKNKPGKELCLYQRANKKAEVQEADSLLNRQ